jgi:hypothetical protein
MDKIPEKFPSIYNSPHYKDINIKLYNQTPYRAIAQWLKEITDCEEDCISASTIGRYNRYVLEHGGFEQLLQPEDINYDDVTLEQLDQHAMNLMYQRLPDLTDGNFVQAFGMILKHSRPTNVNVNADVDAKMQTELLAKLERPLPELEDD